MPAGERPPSLSASLRSWLANCQAGSRPKRTPVASESTNEKIRTASVEANPVEAEHRHVGRRHLPQQVDPPSGDEEADGAAEQAEQHAFGQRLTDEPCAPGAKRCPDRHLAPASCGAREQEIGHVDARDEKHEADRAQQQEQAALQRAGQLFAKRHDPCAVPPVGVGILPRQLLSDAIHVCAGLFDRHPRFHPRVDRQFVIRPVERLRQALERHGRPQLNLRIGKLEGLRQHSDDFVWHAVQEDLAPHDVRIRAETALPQPVSENDDPMLTDLGLFSSEGSPERRLYAQHVEEGRGHGCRREAGRLAGTGQIGRDRNHGGRRLEHGIHARPVHIIGGRDDVFHDALGRSLLPHDREAIGIRVGQRAEEDRIDRGEDRRVRTDTERHGQQCDERHSGLTGDESHRVPNILHERMHVPPPAARFPNHVTSVSRRECQPLGSTMHERIAHRTQPESRQAPPGRSRRRVLGLEHPRHVRAELAANSARKAEQEQPVQLHGRIAALYPRDRTRSRLARASSTAASRRRASAAAACAPSGVSRK